MITLPFPLPLAPPEEKAKYAPCDYSLGTENLIVTCLEKDGNITYDCENERFLASKFAAGCVGMDHVQRNMTLTR